MASSKLLIRCTYKHFYARAILMLMFISLKSMANCDFNFPGGQKMHLQTTNIFHNQILHARATFY